MSVLETVEKSGLRDILGKSWLTHDGLWFFHTAQASGVEQANRLNRAAIRSLAPIEIDRVKKVLAVGERELESFEGAVGADVRDQLPAVAVSPVQGQPRPDSVELPMHVAGAFHRDCEAFLQRTWPRAEMSPAFGRGSAEPAGMGLTTGATV